MAWVNIKNGRYYRRSRRINGRVVNEHLGGGEFGEAMAGLDQAERMGRRIDAGLARADRDVYGFVVRDVFGIDEFLGNLFTVLAHQSGFHLHHRQWRRTRKGNAMSGMNTSRKQIKDLGQQLEQTRQRQPPLMAANFEGLPEADRATLQAAAQGDAAALAKAQPYLTDPKYIKQWGNPMYAARCWLVGQVAGDDAVVGRTTHARANMLQEELGFAEGNMLEKLAITRIIHNWLAVAAFEAKACRIPFHSRERSNVDKSLVLAERRLMQAIKTLAFLRECSVPALMARMETLSRTEVK